MKGLSSRISPTVAEFKMAFEKSLVIDTAGHLLGRLASLIAKAILQGQRIVIV